MDRKRNLTGNLQIITREALASLELVNIYPHEECRVGVPNWGQNPDC